MPSEVEDLRREPEAMKTLFTMFSKNMGGEDAQRLNPRGSGLGLAICKQLCRPITRGGVDSNKCAERGRGTLRAVRPTTTLRARPDQAQGATSGTSYRFLFRIIWL